MPIASATTRRRLPQRIDTHCGPLLRLSGFISKLNVYVTLGFIASAPNWRVHMRLYAAAHQRYCAIDLPAKQRYVRIFDHAGYCYDESKSALHRKI
jgi:hypothetical protein